MGKYRLSRYKKTLALTHGASATTTEDDNVKLNGLLRQALINTPAAVDGSATTGLTIVDPDGFTVYSKTGMAVNTKVVDTPAAPIPLSGLYNVIITFSAAQTATDTSTKVALVVEN